MAYELEMAPWKKPAWEASQHTNEVYCHLHNACANLANAWIIRSLCCQNEIQREALRQDPRNPNQLCAEHTTNYPNLLPKLKNLLVSEHRINTKTYPRSWLLESDYAQKKTQKTVASRQNNESLRIFAPLCAPLSHRFKSKFAGFKSRCTTCGHKQHMVHKGSMQHLVALKRP